MPTLAQPIVSFLGQEPGVGAGSALHYRIAVPAAGPVTLASLLPGGVLPAIPVPDLVAGGTSSSNYVLGFVDFANEVDPSVSAVRVTEDLQSVPQIAPTPLGRMVPKEPFFLRVPTDPANIQLIAANNPTYVQVYMGILPSGMTR